jgi:hypothetical protein
MANQAKKFVKCDSKKAFKFPVGATAIKYGQLCKISSNLMVPCADNDENLSVYVALGNYPANSDANYLAGETTFVSLRDALVGMEYTGGTPALGVSYGISAAGVVDIANTSQPLVTVLEYDAANALVTVEGYQITA